MRTTTINCQAEDVKIKKLLFWAPIDVARLWKHGRLPDTGSLETQDQGTPCLFYSRVPAEKSPQSQRYARGGWRMRTRRDAGVDRERDHDVGITRAALDLAFLTSEHVNPPFQSFELDTLEARATVGQFLHHDA